MFEIIDVPPGVSEAVEQMGSKPKFWFSDPDHGPCLFKASREHAGEDWAEKLAEQIAELLDLPHVTYELADSGGERGVVTPRLTSEGERLVHGNELLIEVDPGYGRGSATYRTSAHTVTAVISALRQPDREIKLPSEWVLPDGVEDAVGVVAGYLMLDAIIGNTDRHHENWALVEATHEGITEYFLAPTFDHASALGRNEPLEKVTARLATKDQNYSPEGYASRTQSALFRNSEDTKPLSPREAFAEIARDAPAAARAWCERLKRLTDEAVEAILSEMPNDRMLPPFQQFASRMISFNRRELQELCQRL